MQKSTVGLLFTLSVISLNLTGCSSLIKSVGIKTTGGIFYDATSEIETEKNWEMFKSGAPSALKLMEGLLFEQPDNQDLLTSVIKGYTGYAFGVNETLGLEDQILEKENSEHLKQALANYSKAISFGFRYLELEGISQQDLRLKINEEGAIGQLLENKLSNSHRDYEAVLYTAQALGGLINLQKNDLALVAQLPIVKAMFDWVCGKVPEINFGACGMFEGAYQAGRPKMLGGDPEKAKKIFLETIAKYPDNALARSTYIQFYLIPQSDEDGYKEQMSELTKVEEAHQAELRWSVSEESKTKSPLRLGLLKAIGLKRYEIFKRNEKKLF